MEYSEQEIKEALVRIEQLDHYYMCQIWRFHPVALDNIYLRSDLPTGKAFKDRLFQHFGGFTPEISKSLGW